ncbi:Uncharacterised protein [Clostridioides difficile]|nr:hypothetical protein [Clostridioides difficile]QPK98891.1 hypothetical protein CDIF101085_00566 [Clostridioides difficile]CCL00182.1 conserved hypothetical protein [Clostridioides difficile E10]VIB29141.1 Uncharacterised protein [Clostridioides difficile]VIF66202.1 Uncharacterised protein [Clostridioides difficile]VIF76041.1 Uncharacterised protein [Clostridioides difficile]
MKIVINSYTSRKLTSGDVFMDYIGRFDKVAKEYIKRNKNKGPKK